MFLVLGGLCYLVALVCFIVILIDAFNKEVWKGIASLLCGFYALYYGFTEFENPNKGFILFIWIFGNIVGWLLFQEAAKYVVR